ncbi:pentatricopeptide repeat-containing family protein [Dorcoceras hygrometricum]|uniref:Pentatricopeptide repeat-containing family protein n=1 Tax=Dorcoceras hygrometricum TaxID=472368 RepID=A0A2Z7AS81_9LAMI|nr:pentatricopeptide repeat-containing family protein [Dorcoceras hygrometricum]
MSLESDIAIGQRSPCRMAMGTTMPISLVDEDAVKWFHEDVRLELEIDLEKFARMSVTAKIGSKDTVTSNYVVPLVELSLDEEEQQLGDTKLCGRKTKLGMLGIYSPVRLQSVKRMKLCSDTKPLKAKEKIQLCDNVKSVEVKKRSGPQPVIVIDISDDSSV